MVISTNREGENVAFTALLAQMLKELKDASHKSSRLVASLCGTKMESFVYDILVHISKGTPFEGSIELVSAQFFPDIVAKQFYGIEVKTSNSNSWKTIGSSVAEGTRIDGVERIYLLFGKLSAPIDFKCRPYEECLSNVAVTHSPRYTIDMNLRPGETLFDKIAIPYDELRKQEDPLSTVVSYLRKTLNPGETTWWLGSNESKSTKAIVRLWAGLTKEEAEELRVKGFCLFPELLGNKQSKFQRMVLWLSTEEGVVVGNLRDQYTAGGKVKCQYDGKTYIIPQILYRLISRLDAIPQMLDSIDEEQLVEYWKISDIADRLDLWCSLIVREASKISNFPLKEFLSITFRTNESGHYITF